MQAVFWINQSPYRHFAEIHTYVLPPLCFRAAHTHTHTAYLHSHIYRHTGREWSQIGSKYLTDSWCGVTLAECIIWHTWIRISRTHTHTYIPWKLGNLGWYTLNGCHAALMYNCYDTEHISMATKLLLQFWSNCIMDWLMQLRNTSLSLLKTHFAWF